MSQPGGPQDKGTPQSPSSIQQKGSNNTPVVAADKKASKPKESNRIFMTVDQKVNAQNFQSNYISTTKYSALTFLPLSLLGQFQRYANIYFLAMAVIQCFPAISPISPVSSIAPLIFVISLSILREGFEDLTRHKSDLELNASKTARYSCGGWEVCDWKDVLVGDLIRVKNGEFFPADMILIRSSDPEGNCNIQTSSLDGEKNLKPRNAVTETQASIENPNLIRIAAQLELEPPNSDLYQCSGTMCIGGDQKIPLTVKNLLLRGALLKNTDWIVGIVGYTGKDTNIMKNAEESKPKQSQIEVKVNNLIILILCFQLVICLVAGVWGGIWYAKYMHEYSPYFRIFPTPGQAGKEGVYLFFTMMILTGTMIPISLIVSLEMVKLVQAMFINNDEDMYFAENDRHCKVFTSSLNEELGQIEFIFSDKTGTLTCNKMEFKNCVIGDTLYGEEVSDQPQMDSKPARPQPLQMRNESHIEGSKPQEAEHVVFNFYDQRITALKNGKVGEDGPSNIKLFYKKDASLTQPVVE